MPPTGYIAPWQRTQAQQDASEAAIASMPRMSLTPVPMAKGESVRLYESWKAPEVVTDVGFEFNRFHQITGSCFLPGTLVTMADGSKKKIEEVKSGDSVLTHKNRPQKVISPTSREYSGGIHYVYAQGKDRVGCTADHKFLARDSENDSWVPAVKLNSRDIYYNYQPVQVDDFIAAEYVDKKKVYCLKVEEDESFLANGYSVHNCVGAGGGCALFSLIAIQRLFAENPTVAFIPWWCFNYGRSRFYAGMRNPGEGSMGATFFKSLVNDGVISAATQGLPQFTRQDGLTLSRQIEINWSDGDSQLVTQYSNVAREHPIGASAQIRDIAQVKASIQNGYPVTFACNNYIGNASIQGTGSDACVVGYWDHYGPHQQSLHAYWEHPTLGPLYYAMNNWPGNTYPKDPAGGPICGCWVKESRVESAMRLDAELFSLSNLTWFPAQKQIMEYFA